MAISVKIPMPLQQFSRGQAKLELKGGTVNEVFKELVSRFPAMEAKLFDAQGKVNAFVNIYVNAEDVRFRKDAGNLRDGDEVVIIYAISGG